MQEISYGQSCVLVEERDYIGLSAASTATEIRSKKISESVVEGPDLRLGLGLGLALGSSCDEKGDPMTLTVKEVSPDRSCISEKLGIKRGPSEIAREPVWLHGSRAISDIFSQESAGDDPPPAKEQILGWPPVRVYRKQTLSKPVEMFVKVNMDGMTVGRKVDLSAYGSYKGLLLALEEMFRPAGRDGDMKHFLLSSGSDYVLTYEDKEGDWMLVGDVPWSMFATTVKRLRIARGMEATGTGVGMASSTGRANFRV